MLIVIPVFVWSWTVMLQDTCMLVKIIVIAYAPTFGFPGWKLAVVGVWESGAGHGLLLCHFHRQLHGSELCQAPAAAEALRGENQVMTRQKWRDDVQTSKWLCSCCCWEPSAQLQPLKTNLTPHPFSEAQHSKKPRHYLLVCVCFWGCMYRLLFVSLQVL